MYTILLVEGDCQELHPYGPSVMSRLIPTFTEELENSFEFLKHDARCGFAHRNGQYLRLDFESLGTHVFTSHVLQNSRAATW